MIGAEEQAFYRSAHVRSQLSSAYQRGNAASGRFALASAYHAVDSSWQAAVFWDNDHPDRWIAWMAVKTWTAGRTRYRWWVMPVESAAAADAMVADWTSFFDRWHPRYDTSRPDSPADAGYWLLHPDWMLMDVPEWVARRVAMLSAAYPGTSDDLGWDPATTSEAIAWAVITVGLQDTAFPPLRHPKEVRRMYGLTRALTPVTVIAALWRLQDLGHPGVTLEIDGSSHAHLDPCELATPARLTALDRWIGAGNYLGSFRYLDAAAENAGHEEIEIFWLAHGKTGDEIVPWREVLAELQLPQTRAHIADLALMWEAGASPAEALAWGLAIGKRRIAGSFAWTQIAVRLLPAGIRAADAAYHTRRRGNAALDTLISHLKHLADTGWTTETMSSIPWLVREQYRKAGHRADEVAQLYDQQTAAAAAPDLAPVG